MSIDYQAHIEVIGPAPAVSAFKAFAFNLPRGATSYGVSMGTNTANHAVFNESTSGSARNMSHQPPELFFLAAENAHAPEFSGLTIRAILVTECVNVEEYVMEEGKQVFWQATEDDLSVDVVLGQPLPVLVHGLNGNPQAWAEACARWSITPTA